MQFNYITINLKSSVPIYRQIEKSVIKAIQLGNLQKGDKLLSVNTLAAQLQLSRDTVLLAYSKLKARGLIFSRPGKGYYISSTRTDVSIRVLLLFDEFNAFKEDLYNAFIDTLSDLADIDIYFHHFNYSLFSSILLENKDRYTSYVIMPANLNKTINIIEQLPEDKVFILDQMPNELKERYPGVYQSFSEDIYSGLKAGFHLIKKYSGLTLVHPGGKEPIGFLDGFKKFCVEFKLPNNRIFSINKDSIKSGWVYILMDDRDLVSLVKCCRANHLILGIDVGVISLNDTGLKEIVADGITTISTDFKTMGKRIARMVLRNEKVSIKNPSQLIVRKSL